MIIAGKRWIAATLPAVQSVPFIAENTETRIIPATFGMKLIPVSFHSENIAEAGLIIPCMPGIHTLVLQAAITSGFSHLPQTHVGVGQRTLHVAPTCRTQHPRQIQKSIILLLISASDPKYPDSRALDYVQKGSLRVFPVFPYWIPASAGMTTR